MPSFDLEESDFHGVIPADTIFEAEFVGCRFVEKNYYEDDGQTKVRKTEFTFVIRQQGVAWEGDTIKGETGTRFNTHPDCKLKNWLQALAGGEEFPAGYRVDTDVLLGNRCRIVVGHRTYEKDGQQKDYNFVSDLMPARQPAGASQF